MPITSATTTDKLVVVTLSKIFLSGFKNAQRYAFDMRTPSVVSISDMPAANSMGGERTAGIGKFPAEAPAVDRQQTDFRGGIEAQPEQQAKGIHLPAMTQEP